MRGMRAWILVGGDLLLLLVGACGHTPVSVPVRPAEDYAFRQTMGGVRVAVDPFFTADRTRQLFSGGEEFPDKGLLPVHVIIENGSGEEVRLDPAEARLLRPDGRPYFSLPPYDAFSMVKVGMGWWAVAAGLGGGAAPAYRNQARQKDIESRALKNAPVAPGTSVSGFLYFSIPEETLNLAGHRVVLPAKTGSGRDPAFEIRIEGRRDLLPARERAPAKTEAPTRTEGTGGQGVIIRSPTR